jgi:FlaA1/EpsC-like NDP-sugar epimerase
VRIQDLAEVMIESLAPHYGHATCDVKIEVIGTQSGEKLYEELMSHEEMRRAVELPDYFSVLPAFRGIYRNINYDYEGIVSDQISNPYISASERPMTKEQLRDFLASKQLLTPGRFPTDLPAVRYWPGDRV